MSASTTMPLLMSVQQAADLLGVSKTTAYDWCVKGIIPSFKVANTRRIRREALMQWMEAQEQEAQAK